MVKKSVARKILKYHLLLEDAGIKVAGMILFGSHARGDARPDSDMDVCVLSPQFGKDRIADGKRLHLLALDVDPLIEPVPFTPNEYRHNKLSPLLNEIRKNGIKIC